MKTSLDTPVDARRYSQDAVAERPDMKTAQRAVFQDIESKNHPLFYRRRDLQTNGPKLLSFPQHPGVEFIRHHVELNDDLVDISVRYNTTPGSIRRYNRKLVFDSLENVMFDWLIIPIDGDEVRKGNTFPDRRPPEQRVVDKKANMLRHFTMHSGPGTKYPRVKKEEALFYLEEAQFDITKALDRWKEDMEWELAHPFEPGRNLLPAAVSSALTATPMTRQRSPSADSLVPDDDSPSPSSSWFRCWRPMPRVSQYNYIELAPISYT